MLDKGDNTTERRKKKKGSTVRKNNPKPEPVPQKTRIMSHRQRILEHTADLWQAATGWNEKARISPWF